VNVTVETAGAVSGYVRDRLSGAGVPNRQVIFYSYTAWTGEWEGWLSTTTDADGYYSALVTWPHTVRARVIPAGAPDTYPEQWYDDSFSLETATEVSLDVGETQALEITIWPGASISGRVSASGEPAVGVTVTALRLKGGEWLSAAAATTDETGDYTIGALPRGTYRVRFTSESPDLFDTYYPVSRAVEDGADVVLDNGEAAEDIDCDMGPAGKVVASVSGSGAVPLGYVRGYLFRSTVSGWQLHEAIDEWDGHLLFGGLQTGTYCLAVDGIDFGADQSPADWTFYGGEFYNDLPAVDWSFDYPDSFSAPTVPSWVDGFDVVEGEQTELGAIELQSQAALDTQAPVTTLTVPAGWANHDVTPVITVSDPGGSPCVTMYGLGNAMPTALCGKPTAITAEGATTVTYYSVDSADNCEAEKTATVRIDKTAPETISDAAPLYPSMAFIHLYPTENLSGLKDTHYILDEGPETIGAVATTAEEGVHELTYWSTDNAGNVEEAKTVAFRVGGELNAPVTNAVVPSGWQQPPVSFELLALDDTDPGPVTHYSLDGSAPSTLYTGPVSMDDDGVWAIKYRSVDSYGNAEVVKFAAIWVDGTPPSTSATAMTSPQEATVTLSATDAHSGVSTTWYRIDGGGETKGTTATISQAGTHEVEYWSIDRAGNEEAPHEVEVLVPYDDSLQLTASATSVTYPGVATLTGRLRDDFGHAVGGEKVVADWSADGIAWSQVATATAGTSVGTYTVAQRPKATGYYRVRSIGSAAHHAAVSGSARVAVTATLKTPTTPLSVNRNRMFTTTSYVGPTHPTGKSAIVFKFYRYQSGKWVRRKTVNATAGAYRSTSTRLTARTSLPYAGRWRVCAYHAKDAEHPTAVTSSYRTFTVK
jgi:hypothetical protein